MNLQEYLEEAVFIKNKPLKRKDMEIGDVDYKWNEKYNIGLEEFEKKIKENYEDFLKKTHLNNAPSKYWPLKEELATLYKAMEFIKKKSRFEKMK